MPELGLIEISTVIGSVVGIASFIFAIIFFAAGRQRRALSYRISSTPLVTDEMTSIPNLEVFYLRQPVENLTSTTIIFTNIGNQLLDMQSFAEKQPLCLTASGHFFQGQSAVNASADNPNSTPSLSTIDARTQKVAFDFLAPKKSFQLTLLHDGKLSVSGDIKGGMLVDEGGVVIRSSPPGLLVQIATGVCFFSIFTAAMFLLVGITENNFFCCVFSLACALLSVFTCIPPLIYISEYRSPKPLK